MYILPLDNLPTPFFPPFTENTSGMFSNNKWRTKISVKVQHSKKNVRKVSSLQPTTTIVVRRIWTPMYKNTFTYKSSGTEIKMQVYLCLHLCLVFCFYKYIYNVYLITLNQGVSVEHKLCESWCINIYNHVSIFGSKIIYNVHIYFFFFCISSC